MHLIISAKTATAADVRGRSHPKRNAPFPVNRKQWLLEVFWIFFYVFDSVFETVCSATHSVLCSILVVLLPTKILQFLDFRSKYFNFSNLTLLTKEL